MSDKIQKEIDNLNKQVAYLERAMVLNFENEEEKEKYLELIRQGKFEELDKDFPITEEE